MTVPLTPQPPANDSFQTRRWRSGEQHFWPAPRWLALQRRILRGHMEHALISPLYRPRRSRYLAWANEVKTGAAGIYFGNLPFTSKEQLPAAVDQILRDSDLPVREWVTTSGTLGGPLSVPLTRPDLDRLAANEAAALALAGIRPGDLVLSTVAMDRQFVAGLAYWLGLQRLGAGAVRAGPLACASWDVLQELLKRYRPQWLITVPSLLLPLCGQRRRGGYRGLRGIIGIGEATRGQNLLPNAMAKALAVTFGAPVLNTYASTETCATFAEGLTCTGGHLNPQLAICEIIDAHGVPLPPGAPGEVVVTPLGVQGLPLIRFRTGDIAALYADPCPCGRTTPRLGPVLGRLGQLLKIRGVSVYPSTVFNVLDGHKNVADSAAVATRDAAGGDVLTLHVQLGADTPDARAAVEAGIRAVLRVLPVINYCDGAGLRAIKTGAGRKPLRFVDRR